MRRGEVFHALFGERSLRLADFVFLLTFLMPPDGFGISICASNALFSVPCPACGLTRSLSCISHLRLADSLRFHPLGFVVYGLLVAMVLVSLLGEGRRLVLRKWLDRHHQGARLAFHAFIAGFVGLGFARLAVALLFPAWLEHV